MNTYNIGPHRFVSGRIEDGVIEHLLRGEGGGVDVVYTDPPWGPGMLKWFAKHNGGDGSKDWKAFLTHLCRGLSHATDGYIFVEMGLEWVDELAECMAFHGIPEQGRWEVFYMSGGKVRPQRLWMGSRSPPHTPPSTWGDPATSVGGCVLWALQQGGKLGGTVLDPCIGLGLTAKAALKLGMVVYGAELNAVRLEKTMAHVRRIGGL